MSFNGSFGDADFVNEENPNNISLGQEDIKLNLACDDNTKKNTETKCFINNEISIPTNSNNNNIFCSVPMELEEDNNTNNNINEDYYMDLLSKELLKYNLCNLFNILNEKKTIIKSILFYDFKKMYKNKLNTLINSQIMFYRISSSLNIIKNIIQRRRENILYQIFYKLKRKYNLVKDKQNNDLNNFRANFELNYTKEKNNIINQNNNSIKSLQKDIQALKKNINQLTLKESKLKNEIYNYLQEEKKINEKLKNIENLNNSIMKSIQTNNSSSIKSFSRSEILSLENTIKVSKQLKDKKEEIISTFVNQVNNLLNEYQAYIDHIKNLDISGSSTKNINSELTMSSNLQSIKQKDSIENSLFASKFSNKNRSNES